MSLSASVYPNDTPLTLDDLNNILSSRFKNDNVKSLKDLPHPHSFKDCELAAKLCAQGIQKNSKILIIGDYDVDGVMATVIMMKFFKMLDYQNIKYTIPNRFNDGYGISKNIVAQHKNIDLIITVDNGIAAFEAAQYCYDQNIPLIITDHHNPQESIPKAAAIINPKQKNCPFAQKDICGAAVAWYFCNAIKLALNQNFSLQPLLKYVMLATISDMMPLININRLFVKKGLQQFINSEEKSDILLKTLLKNTQINAQDISFYIVPLLNSAGRIKDAKLACDFFLAQNEDHIKAIFYDLKSLNLERKTITQEVYNLAISSLVQTPNYVLAFGENFNDGVLGIVAARLVESYLRPAFVFTKKQDGSFKGSGRSDGKINIFETLLPFQNNFLHFGGHAEAVGISLDSTALEKFGSFFSLCIPLNKKEKSDILGFLELESINYKLLEIINSFEPYGQGNQIPKFCIKNLKITQHKKIKDIHQRLEFNHKIWGMDFFSKQFYETGEYVDITCSLTLDFYKQISLQIHSITHAI